MQELLSNTRIEEAKRYIPALCVAMFPERCHQKEAKHLHPSPPVPSKTERCFFSLLYCVLFTFFRCGIVLLSPASLSVDPEVALEAAVDPLMVKGSVRNKTAFEVFKLIVAAKEGAGKVGRSIRLSFSVLGCFDVLFFFHMHTYIGMPVCVAPGAFRFLRFFLSSTIMTVPQNNAQFSVEAWGPSLCRLFQSLGFSFLFLEMLSRVGKHSRSTQRLLVLNS